MFFGTLIATYMVYKNRSLDGPLPRETFVSLKRGSMSRMKLRTFTGSSAVPGC